MVYTANPAGYIMTQGADGVPVTIPVQAGGGMIAIQASGAQGDQPPLVQVPAVSGAAGGQHVMVQSPPHAAMSATDSLPQEAEKPPPYA